MNAFPLPAALLWHSNAILRDSLVGWFESKFAGHPLYVADSPAHAFELAGRGAPALALVDIDRAPAHALDMIRRWSDRRPPLHC